MGDWYTRQSWVKGLPILGLLWLIGAVGDRIWFALDRSVPAWDQADYLTGALNYWQALRTAHWFSGTWWTEFWQLSSKVPPLVYILTAPVLSFFGSGADQSTLVNLLFSGILLSSVYTLGIVLFTLPVALWAVGFCLLLPGLYRLRLEYLLDYPLTAMVTLCFLCITLWREMGHRQRLDRQRLDRQRLDRQRLDRQRLERRQETGKRQSEVVAIAPQLHQLQPSDADFSPEMVEDSPLTPEAPLPAIPEEQPETQLESRSVALATDSALSVQEAETEPENSVAATTQPTQPLVQPQEVVTVPPIQAESPIQTAATLEDLPQQIVRRGNALVAKIQPLRFRLQRSVQRFLPQIRRLPGQLQTLKFHLLPFSTWQPWLYAIAIGVTLGLALMVKQSALLFLLVPLLWVGLETIGQLAWLRLGQWVLAIAAAIPVFYPWYRTNWLLMLTAGKRATVDSAIAEGDPGLLSLDAWIYYLKLLPQMVSVPLLVVPLLGLLFYWRRARVSSQWMEQEDYAAKSRDYRNRFFKLSRRSLFWLTLFWISAYLLSSLNPNKDFRYVLPYLPVLALILAYGFTLLPRRWKVIHWGTIGLAITLMVANLLPIGNLEWRSVNRHHPYRGEPFPHPQVIKEVIQTEPYLRSTIGVLPSTPVINQHNVNYFGLQQNFQVYGRQVGTRTQQVEQDGRSFAWFLTKTGDQGSIRNQAAQTALVNLVAQGEDFQLHKSWNLSDNSQLQLYHRRVPAVEVRRQEPVLSQNLELTTKNSAPIRLDRVIVPAQVPPGQPIPITYEWSGFWKPVRTGLLLLTWRKQGEPSQTGGDRWLHDHALGMGMLRSGRDIQDNSSVQVIERMAMLPPASLSAGVYRLEATYVNRNTGDTLEVTMPSVTLRIAATATPVPAPELDLVTQLRTLGATLPQGTEAVEQVFAEIGRINQYDPVQDYVSQTRQAMEYRLRQEPQNLEFAYTLALANVLKRRVQPAIYALQKVVQLDPKNPYAYGYLAFVNLYDFRPLAAESAIDRALTLQPNLVEFHALKAIAALMQGNLRRAWQEAQIFRGQAG